MSRHRDVEARIRVSGPEALIGRGYDNDVIVDDPYVAVQHLRIFRDDSGQIVAEDVGSANGTFLDGGKDRLQRIVIDGAKPIRIGQTFLRVRAPDFVVERERIAPPERGILPIVLVMALGAFVLGISALRVWLTQTTEPRASAYLTPLLTVIGAVVAWAGLWALLSRIFSGRSRFMLNLLIALAGITALLLYEEFGRFAAFALTWPTVGTYQYVAAWSVLAAICFLHLRGIGRTRLWLKGGIVTTLLAIAISAQALQRSEAFSDLGRQTTTRLLMPPALRAVPVRDQDAFFGEIRNLKARIDSDRSQARPG
ncbi:MAG: FHA domain-containing protein [Bradyrhizobium sp.]